MQGTDRNGRLLFIIASAALVTIAACVDLDVAETDAETESTSALVVPDYPLKRGPSGSRYLVDQKGAPFLWTGDTAWSLIAQLTTAQATRYLDDRKAKGFDLILANLIEHKFASRAPANIAGQLPFTGKPFTTPNALYFAHADEVIAAADARGIAVLLDPLYLGYACGAEGWCGEVSRATTADLYAWGRYVGARYRAFDNIVWLIGGDTDPSPVRDKVLSMIRGIRETDSRHLFTAHNDETTARTRWPGQDWLTIDNVYTYNSSLWQNDRAVYSTTPAMPYFLLESYYEREHSVTAQHLRAQTYWTMLSGGMGQIFGNCPNWHFGSSSSWCGTTDWVSNLNSVGSVNVVYFNRLFRSRPWHLLVPDFGSAIVTSGMSSGTSLATAARTSDGDTIMVYVPSRRAVTINMSKISGSNATVWWYSPATGVATKVGTYPTSSSRTFQSPDGDSVLVIDDTSRGFPAPGSSTTTAAATTTTPSSTSTPPPTSSPTSSPTSTPTSTPTSSPTSTDVVVNFESSSDDIVLTSEGGITWPRSGMLWRVWNGGSAYTKNAYIDSTARTEVTATFTLPSNSLLKSLRIAVGSGGHATSVKISSPGNPERVYTDIYGWYLTKSLGWTTRSSTIVVKVICDTTDGASDLAFDTITYTQ